MRLSARGIILLKADWIGASQYAESADWMGHPDIDNLLSVSGVCLKSSDRFLNVTSIVLYSTPVAYHIVSFRQLT
ncbi:MAG: hypothetical protein WAN65_25840 [Candidatus Sulfotelmatobacter sp.]